MEFSFQQIEALLPLACAWAEKQEQFILQNGIPLNENQLADAKQIGVNFPERVRLLKVESIPQPEDPALHTAVDFLGFLSSSTIGLSLRYGIFIQAEHWGKRSLVVHELTHTQQFERMGGFDPFLRQYLRECMNEGYHFSPMEQEARQMEKIICG